MELEKPSWYTVYMGNTNCTLYILERGHKIGWVEKRSGLERRMGGVNMIKIYEMSKE